MTVYVDNAQGEVLRRIGDIAAAGHSLWREASNTEGRPE